MAMSGKIKTKQERNQAYFDELMAEVSKSNPSSLDKVSAILMNHYSKKSRTSLKDVQDEFRDSLKKSTMFTLEKDKKEILDNEQSKSKEQVMKEELVKNKEKATEEQEKIQEAKELESQELLTGDNLQGTKEEKEQVLAAMYLSALNEYYNLKLEVDRELARDLEVVAPNDRLHSKYISYQKYIKNIDTYYKNMTGSYISSDNHEIKKVESKFLRFDALGEHKIEENRSKVVHKATDIQNEIEQIQEEIIKLNNTLSDGNISVEEYEYMLDNLQVNLMKKNNELDNMNPSIEDIERQDEKREEIKKAEDRIVGTKYERIKGKTTKDLYGSKTITKLDKIEQMDERNDRVTDKVVKDKSLTTKELVDNYIKEAEEALENGNIEEAKKLIEIAKETAGYEQNLKIDEFEEKEINQISNEQVEEGNKEDTKKSEISSKFKESLKEEVIAEEELLRKDIESIKNFSKGKDEKSINETYKDR